MQTLREALQEAQKKGSAIGHFNVSDSTQLNAIFAGAQELSMPVIIGVSEGEREYIGAYQIVALVDTLREVHDFPIFLNADHSHSIDDCKFLIDLGFDAVLFDGSKLSTEENIEMTKEVVMYARDSGRDVLVEAELGYIGASSKLLDAVPEDVKGAMTDPKEAKDFVEKTGIDLLAPAVGNLHGMLKGRANPALNIERVKEISERVRVPLVLHGGSGISDSDFTASIKAGVRIVHINTEIRVAYRKGIEEGLGKDSDEIAPYRYLGSGFDKVKETVKERLTLFGNA